MAVSVLSLSDLMLLLGKVSKRFSSGGGAGGAAGLMAAALSPRPPSPANPV
jgi:hypothetical protein